jgi:hypothetical protein
MRPRHTNPRRGNAIQAVYPMKNSMLIKCDKCGYENFPQHRFCGMCAAELAIPQAPSAAAARAPRPATPRLASRPATAKVEHAPVDARSVSYLLDDEPPPSRGGRYVWLLVLLLVGAAAAWHWREDLGSVVARLSSSGASTSGQPNTSPPTAPSSGPDVAPASPASGSSEAKTPSTTTDAQGAQAQQSSPPPVPNAGDPAQSPPDQSAASKTAPQGDAQPETPEAGAQPAPATRASKPQVRSASAGTIEDMEAEGEKYLYGNGVPENCGRARKSLLTAAGHSSAKAQNVLGTMYATGHCATRDLPTAYRWFGRSLRQDPGNTRIVQDLKVLWNQMTPEERQVALRNHP